MLDKITIIYGPSGKEKSDIVNNALGVLSDCIERTDAVSQPGHTYARCGQVFNHFRTGSLYGDTEGETPQKAAHRFLESIGRRQEMATAIYARANRPEVLSKLYNHLTTLERKCADASIRMIRRKGVEDNTPAGEVRELLGQVRKECLSRHSADLWERRLTEEERHALHHINYNPRSLVVIDSPDLPRTFYDDEYSRKLFYRNRWLRTTVIICSLDDKDLPAALRKNATNAIFTSSEHARAYFDRCSNGHPKTERKYVADNVHKFFGGGRNLVHIRGRRERIFRRLTLPHPKGRQPV